MMKKMKSIETTKIKENKDKPIREASIPRERGTHRETEPE